MGAGRQIKRSLKEPAYLQLADIIKEQISVGVYRSGDRLPSESQLREKYNLSPMTIRRAITMLIEKGVVHTVQGLGTFVNTIKLQKATFGLGQIFEIFEGNDTIRIKILEAAIVKADETIAHRLDCPVDTNTIHIRRLFTNDKEPVFYHYEFLIYDPRRPLIEGELQINALIDLFSGGDESDLKWGKIRVSAAILTDEESSRLKRPPGSAAMHLEHTFFDHEDQKISWGVFVCSADKFHLNTTVGQVPDRIPDKTPGKTHDRIPAGTPDRRSDI